MGSVPWSLHTWLTLKFTYCRNKFNIPSLCPLQTKYVNIFPFTGVWHSVQAYSAHLVSFKLTNISRIRSSGIWRYPRCQKKGILSYIAAKSSELAKWTDLNESSLQELIFIEQKKDSPRRELLTSLLLTIQVLWNVTSVSTGKYLPAFLRNVMRSSSGLSTPWTASLFTSRHVVTSRKTRIFRKKTRNVRET